MPVSMRDVAALAGVSERTVSNVVNDFVHVKPETRARVQRAVDLLGYRPNLSARKLRGGRSRIIALAIPEIAPPYFAELADLIQREAAARDHLLLIEQTGGTRRRELSLLGGYPAATIDGLLLNPISITADDLLEASLGVPTVLLGERIDPPTDPAGSRFVHVSIDNVAGARTVTDHLLGLGRRRIVALGASLAGSADPGPGVRRTRGYLAALADAGVDPTAELIVPVDRWTAESGHRAVSSLLDAAVEFDAIFCFNDTLAVGALSSLAARGVDVPGRVAVVGWDDTRDSAFTTPSLTTLAPATPSIAKRSVEVLLDLVDGREVVDDVLLPYSLRERASSVGAARG